MADNNLEIPEKKGLDDSEDKLQIYIEQIRQKAFELQWGSLIVEFKVFAGKVKTGRVLQKVESLQPY